MNIIKIFLPKGCTRIFIGCLLVLVPLMAWPYKLQPAGTAKEEEIARLEQESPSAARKAARYVIDHFSNPVHEELTNRTLGCNEDISAEKPCRQSLDPLVQYGVQWNDNPPFDLNNSEDKQYCKAKTPIRLPNRQPVCWVVLFDHAERNLSTKKEKRYNRQNNYALLYRSHFGDLQFLHSMASWDGETMWDTKQNILAWAEFTYRLALDKGGVSADRISPFVVMGQVPVSRLKERQFLGNGFDAHTLFTWGIPEYQPKDIPAIAFGSLLHMIQDSFSKSHVTRSGSSGECSVQKGTKKAGRILEFLSYGSQDSGEHGKRDSREFMMAGLAFEPNAVSIGKQLKQYLDSNTPWATVSRYLDECVFDVDPNDYDSPAGPGSELEKKKNNGVFGLGL